MKVAIIGTGNVGLATFDALLTMREITHLVLCGRNPEKIRGEIEDYKDSIVLRSDIKCRISGGGYEHTKDANIIIYTAGSPRNPNQSRLDLANENIRITKEIFDEVDKYNKDAFIIVVSNPVDVITKVICDYTKRQRSRVIGTGTLLDTARLKKCISDFLEISPESINVNVIGEHGNSACIIWSELKVAGSDLRTYCQNLFGNEDLSLNKKKLHNVVVTQGSRIIKRKGSTSRGVAAASSAIVSALIHDSNVLMPVSVLLEGEYGVDNIAISVPCIIGANGARPQYIFMNEKERARFEESVSIIRDTIYNSSLFSAI